MYADTIARTPLHVLYRYSSTQLAGSHEVQSANPAVVIKLSVPFGTVETPEWNNVRHILDYLGHSPCYQPGAESANKKQRDAVEAALVEKPTLEVPDDWEKTPIAAPPSPSASSPAENNSQGTPENPAGSNENFSSMSDRYVTTESVEHCAPSASIPPDEARVDTGALVLYGRMTPIQASAAKRNIYVGGKRAPDRLYVGVKGMGTDPSSVGKILASAPIKSGCDVATAVAIRDRCRGTNGAPTIVESAIRLSTKQLDGVEKLSTQQTLRKFATYCEIAVKDQERVHKENAEAYRVLLDQEHRWATGNLFEKIGVLWEKTTAEFKRVLRCCAGRDEIPDLVPNEHFGQLGETSCPGIALKPFVESFPPMPHCSPKEADLHLTNSDPARVTLILTNRRGHDKIIDSASNCCEKQRKWWNCGIGFGMSHMFACCTHGRLYNFYNCNYQAAARGMVCQQDVAIQVMEHAAQVLRSMPDLPHDRRFSSTATGGKYWFVKLKEEYQRKFGIKICMWEAFREAKPASTFFAKLERNVKKGRNIDDYPAELAIPFLGPHRCLVKLMAALDEGFAPMDSDEKTRCDLESYANEIASSEGEVWSFFSDFSRMEAHVTAMILHYLKLPVEVALDKANFDCLEDFMPDIGEEILSRMDDMLTRHLAIYGRETFGDNEATSFAAKGMFPTGHPMTTFYNTMITWSILRYVGVSRHYKVKGDNLIVLGSRQAMEEFAAAFVQICERLGFKADANVARVDNSCKAEFCTKVLHYSGGELHLVKQPKKFAVGFSIVNQMANDYKTRLGLAASFGISKVEESLSLGNPLGLLMGKTILARCKEAGAKRAVWSKEDRHWMEINCPELLSVDYSKYHDRVKSIELDDKFYSILADAWQCDEEDIRTIEADIRNAIELNLPSVDSPTLQALCI